MTQKRKRSPSLDSVVVLETDDCGSGSDSESKESGSDSESESDSDGLESWMILGSGNQAGDQSISLNLEGQADCNAGVCGSVCLYLRLQVGAAMHRIVSVGLCLYRLRA